MDVFIYFWSPPLFHVIIIMHKNGKMNKQVRTRFGFPTPNGAPGAAATMIQASSQIIPY